MERTTGRWLLQRCRGKVAPVPVAPASVWAGGPASIAAGIGVGVAPASVWAGARLRSEVTAALLLPRPYGPEGTGPTRMEPVLSLLPRPYGPETWETLRFGQPNSPEVCGSGPHGTRCRIDFLLTPQAARGRRFVSPGPTQATPESYYETAALARMFRAALWSAFIVCPQLVQ